VLKLIPFPGFHGRYRKPYNRRIIAVYAILIRKELLIPFNGGIFVAESLSVIRQ
jgi:hypothetical protein